MERKDKSAAQDAAKVAAQHKAAAEESRAAKATKHELYPSDRGFYPAEAIPVGGVVLCNEDIPYNLERRTITITVRNTGDRPIQVGSHFHFFEANRYLEFDREAAFGCHLNIPATTAIRFEPGDEKQVEVVSYAGKRRIVGFNGLVNGYAGEEDAPVYLPTRHRAFEHMHKAGFKCSHKHNTANDNTGNQNKGNKKS